MDLENKDLQEDKLSQEDRLSIEEDVLLSDFSSDDMPFSQESENTDMAVESLQPSKKKRKKEYSQKFPTTDTEP